MKTIELLHFTEDIVTDSEFIRIAGSSQSNIENVEILMPNINDRQIVTRYRIKYYLPVFRFVDEQFATK